MALTGAFALFLRLDEHSSYVVLVLPSMLLLGVGFALAFPSVNIAATDGVADEEQGLASGLVNTAIQVGTAVVLAGATAMITAGSAGGDSPQAQLDGYRPALVFVTAVALVGLVVAAAGALVDRRRNAVPASVPDYDYQSAGSTTTRTEVLTER